MTNARALLTIMADPTRQALVDALRAGPLTVGELAERVPVSRSAVSQHLQVLRTAEIVDNEADGTRRLYRLQPQALGELRAYVDALWGDALGNFAAHAGPAPKKKGRKA